MVQLFSSKSILNIKFIEKKMVYTTLFCLFPLCFQNIYIKQRLNENIYVGVTMIFFEIEIEIEIKMK